MVSNGERGAWSDDSVWQLREDLRIRSSNKVGRQFGRIGGIAVNSRGEVFVLDALNQRVLHYDSAGQYLRTIGRAGTGPGEFATGGSSASSILIGAADSVVVADIGNLRVNVFSPDGRFIRAFPISLEGGPPVRWAVLPDGRLVEQVQTVFVRGQAATKPSNALLIVPADGSKRDTLLHLPLGAILDVRGGIGAVKTQLLPAEVLWDVGPDGQVIVANGSTYRILVYDWAGALKMVVTKPTIPRPVSSDDRRDILNAFKNAFQSQSLPMPDSQKEVLTRQLVDNAEIPSTYPALAAIRAGPAGTIMARHVATVAELKGSESELTLARQREGSRDWDVFDRDGRYLGVVQFPPRFQLTAIVRNAFYGIENDSLDVPSVVRLELHPVQ